MIWKVVRTALDQEGRTVTGRYVYLFSNYDAAHVCYADIKHNWICNTVEPPEKTTSPSILNEWKPIASNLDHEKYKVPHV